jgi:cytochrome c peroxidase
MRSGPPAAFEQLQCILRPVGTIVANGAVPTGVSPAAVGVLELRQDMVTGAQGAGGVNANDFTTGFNPPSLLGLQVGAPYFHAGNASTLEELLSSQFLGHHQSAIASVFTPSATDIQQLVAYMLSLDGSTAPVTIPVAGNGGGDICAYP